MPDRVATPPPLQPTPPIATATATAIPSSASPGPASLLM